LLAAAICFYNMKQWCYFFIVLMSGACSRPVKEVLLRALPAPTIITVDSIGQEVFEDTEFGIQLMKKSDDYSLVWLDKEKSICFQPFERKKTIRRVSIKHIAGVPQNYNVRLSADTLFFLDFTNQVFVVSRIEKDTAIVLETYNLGPWLQKQHCIIGYQTWNTFEVRYPYLYLSLASKVRESNFIYPAAYARLTLLKHGDFSATFLPLHTPKKYYKRKEYNTNKYFQFFDDTTFVYGFQTFDSIYTGNTVSGQICERADFNAAAEYRVFSHSKVMDMAYVRWHVNTNESNPAMFASNNKLVIIKQRQRKELKDSVKYEYFVLNRQLQTIYHAPFEQNFNYRLSFPYKSGFIVINPEKKEGYYYEIPQ
jgi:hypothetical protein